MGHLWQPERTDVPFSSSSQHDWEECIGQDVSGLHVHVA